MKKYLLALGLVSLIVGGLSAQSVTITNTFGGNSDNTGTSDFLKFDDNGDKDTAVVGDRIQLDVASEHIDSRVRLNISGDNNFSLGLQGYLNFRPFKQVNFIGGNKFFWKWATPGAYLGAIDDYLVHGKLADDNGGGVVLNFDSENSKVAATFAGAVGLDSKLDLNFGTQFNVKNLFILGLTGQDLTKSSASFAGYVALTAVKNLTLNFGYTYNNTDKGYIQGTQHLAQISVGYKFEAIPLTVYADGLTGLNNNSNYIELTESYVDLDSGSGVPFYAAFRANYNVSDYLDINGSVKVNHKLELDDSVTTVTVYPYFDVKTKIGTFRSGARVLFDSDDGYKGFNIPFSWQYKIAAKL